MTAYSGRGHPQDPQSGRTQQTDQPVNDSHSGKDGLGDRGLEVITGLVLAGLAGGELYYAFGSDAASAIISAVSAVAVYLATSVKPAPKSAKSDGTGARTGVTRGSHRKRSREVTTRLAFTAIVIFLGIADGMRLYHNMQHGKNHAATPPSSRPGVPAEVRVQPALDWSAQLQVGQTAQFVIPLRSGYSHAAVTFSVQDADARATLCAPDTTLTVAVGPGDNPGRKVTLQPGDWTTTVDVTGFTGSVPVQMTVGNTMVSQDNCPVVVGVPNVTLTNH